MPIFARTFQELMTDSISDLSTNTTITRFAPGAIARSLLEATNQRLSEAYEIFDVNMAQAFVSAATGQWLDYIGILLGVTRIPPQAARVDSDTRVMKFYVQSGTFGDINGGQDIYLPANVMLSTLPFNSGITYRTTVATILPQDSSYAWVSIEANGTGTVSNLGSDSLTNHEFIGYLDYLNGTLRCTNVHSVANGSNMEDDANYKYRIINQTLSSEAANQTAIRLAALSTPGVADVILIPYYRGIGTFGVIIKSITPTVSQSLLDAVAYNIELIKGFGGVSYVRKPKETGISMTLTIHYASHIREDELATIETSIRNYVADHVNNLDIGEDLLINPLGAGLFSLSDQITNIGEAGTFFDEVNIYRDSRLQDNRIRQTLLGDYSPAPDERVIIEPTLATPITLLRDYVRK
jgi:uncharacterized phage protein gp47/JayE